MLKEDIKQREKETSRDTNNVPRENDIERLFRKRENI